MLRDKFHFILEWVVIKLLRTRWIVSIGEEDTGELGIRIAGINLWYYKWPDPMVDTQRPFRNADKREFGEVVLSRGHTLH